MVSSPVSSCCGILPRGQLSVIKNIYVHKHSEKCTKSSVSSKSPAAAWITCSGDAKSKWTWQGKESFKKQHRKTWKTKVFLTKQSIQIKPESWWFILNFDDLWRWFLLGAVETVPWQDINWIPAGSKLKKDSVNILTQLGTQKHVFEGVDTKDHSIQLCPKITRIWVWEHQSVQISDDPAAWSQPPLPSQNGPAKIPSPVGARPQKLSGHVWKTCFLFLPLFSLEFCACQTLHAEKGAKTLSGWPIKCSQTAYLHQLMWKFATLTQQPNKIILSC